VRYQIFYITGLTEAKYNQLSNTDSLLYTSIIRSVLKQASMESMVTQGYISALDSVQEKCGNCCTEKISFDPQSKRRHWHWFDLIERHKFINNKYKTGSQTLFSLPHSGHEDKLFRPSAKTDVQKPFSHIVYAWIPGIYCLPR